VAHPKQLQQWRGEAPNLYDISGSAHFINKADNGLVVHRSWRSDGDPREVQILVRKVRNKAAGKVGDAVLLYDRVTGTYAERPPGEASGGGGGGYGNGNGSGGSAAGTQWGGGGAGAQWGAGTSYGAAGGSNYGRN
jgi:hypothetical protein